MTEVSDAGVSLTHRPGMPTTYSPCSGFFAWDRSYAGMRAKVCDKCTCIRDTSTTHQVLHSISDRLSARGLGEQHAFSSKCTMFVPYPASILLHNGGTSIRIGGVAILPTISSLFYYSALAFLMQHGT